MQKLKKWIAPLAFVAIGLSHAQASEFAGPYAGIKYGVDFSHSTGQYSADENVPFFGILGGYNWDFQNVVIGAEVFGDFHHHAATKKDGGIDAKLGYPINSNVMPYVRLGLTGTWPNTRVHYGVGAEYMFAKNFSVAAEWTADTANTHGSTRSNDSVTVGVHYYFK